MSLITEETLYSQFEKKMSAVLDRVNIDEYSVPIFMWNTCGNLSEGLKCSIFEQFCNSDMYINFRKELRKKDIRVFASMTMDELFIGLKKA